MRKNYPLIVLWLAGALCATAQDSTKVTTLKEIVVSASRTEEPVIEVPRSVTVISGEQIRTSVYQSVGDLLNSTGGLFIVGANQTPGTNQNIFMRGANSNQVAVLVDGVRITDPSSPNAAIDFSEMSLTNVERIEVIRGSHSTVFGGAAIGGVINIITRKNNVRGIHGDVSWQGGTFGHDAWSSLENVNLTYGHASGVYVNGSMFRQDVKGLDAVEAQAAAPAFISDRDDFRKTDFALKGGYRRDAWDASVSFRSSHQYTEIDDGAFRNDENSYLVFDRRLLNYSARYKINDRLSGSLIGSFSESERFFEDDSSRVDASTWDHLYSTGTYFGRLQTHELQLNYRSGAMAGVVGGGFYRERMFFDNYLLYNDPSFSFEVVTNYDTIHSTTTTGYLFAQLEYGIGNFRLSGGARGSSHTTAGEFATFELNPSWTYRDLLIYGSLSTGFNTPSLYQLYDPSKDFGAYATRGNRNLKPERSVSFEAGVKKQFASGTYFTVSAYTTRVRNSIEYVYLWNSDKPIGELDFSDSHGDRYINVAEQRVKGIEVEGFVKISPALSLRGNVSLLEAEVRASPDDLDFTDTGGYRVQLYNLGTFLDQDFKGSEVVRRPALTSFSRVNFKATKALTFYAIHRFTGKRFDAGYDGSMGPAGGLASINVDAYHLVDVGASWNATESFSIGVKVENLLDEDYREVLGFRTIGRSVHLKAAFRF